MVSIVGVVREWCRDQEGSRLSPLSCSGCSSSHLPAPQLAWRQELSTEPPSGSCPCSLSSSQIASVLQQIGQQLVSEPLASPLGRTTSHCFTHSYNKSLIPWYSVLISWWNPDYSTHTPSYSRNYVWFLSHFYLIRYCSFIPHRL